MTKTRAAAFLASVLLLSAAAFPVRSAAPPSSNQPYVVLVGIDNYADKQILPRAHAEADAKGFYDLLTDTGYLGVDQQHVRLLLGNPDPARHSEPANHDNIIKALKWVGASAGKNDLVILSFFCQGAPLGEKACYFAVDSTFKDRTKNAVAAGDVENAFDKLKSQRFCVFMDVNFKGFDPGKETAPEVSLGNFYREFLGHYNSEEHTSPRGRILFLANSGLKPSLEASNHGVFAQVILDGLKGGADKEGYEPDGAVTVDELSDYVNKELPEMARKIGKTREEKEQRDYIMGSRNTHFDLVRNPAVIAKVRDRLDKFAKLAAETKLSKELTEEGHNLLDHMPKLEAYRNLRKDYQELADGALTVDQFTKKRADIFDDMKMKRTVAQDFASKVIQASQLILKEYVKKVNQGDLVTAAIKGLYQRIEGKIPADIKERLDQAKDLKEADLTELLTDVRERLGKREDLDNHKDIDFALQNMMLPLDPYTTYIDPETLSQFKRETQGNFTGIGIQIRTDSASDMLVVITPIKDSPAYKKGIKAGDIITKVIREVDNRGRPLKTPEVISTKGLAITDAVTKIVGKAGSKVKLVVEREGSPEPIEFEITRGQVEVETVLGTQRKLDDSWDYLMDHDNQIAYVRLTSFARNTSRDLDKVLKYLKNTSDIKGFILDLRFNPGGLLTSAVEISDMFIDDGLIVTIKPRVGREAAYTGEHEGSYLDFPMVCLVNGHSASGSEIVAGCLQDQKRAIIMGERSYGKGSVQNIQPFEEGEIKLTTASFWRPNGKNLNKSSTSGKDSDEWGVKPDNGFAVKLARKDRDQLEEHLHKMEIINRRDQPAKEADKPFKDVQLEKALEYLRGQIKIGSRVASKKAG